MLHPVSPIINFRALRPMPPFFLAAAVGICLSILPATAQESPPPSPTVSASTAEPTQDDLFVESIDVNVVNVDVFVTDKTGARISGLTKDDFELFEDGRPVEITNFYAVKGGRPTRPTVEAEKPSETAPATPLPLLATVEDQQLHLVIYFDNLFLRPFNRNKLIDHVRRFVFERVGSEDSVMLASFERSLHIRHPFTTHHEAVLREMENLREMTAFGVQQRTERRDLLNRIDSSRSASEAISHVDFYAKSLHNDLTQSIEALREVVSSLAGLPGRKALLYVSDGIPMTPAEDLFHLIDQTYKGNTTAPMIATRYRTRRRFNELTAHANANRVSFYTVEAAGLTSHESLSAEYGQRETSIIEADVMRDGNREEPLVQMAHDTGGLFALNTNNFDGAFDKIGQDFRNYYSLGYAPVHAVPGRYHEIEVKVRRKGLEVRHRAGYRDKSPEVRMNEGTLAALLHGIEKNPLGIRFETGRSQPSGTARYLVPLLVRIPLGQIALIPQGDTHRGAVRVSVAVMNEDRTMSPVSQTPVPINIPNTDVETARGQEFVYEAEILMHPGSHIVAIGVRDDLSDDTSFVRQLVRAGS
ncbi:MAG: VWA domain-containing protein [bacterium]|nr:VWA domain-containing protein [bacterium]